MKGNMAFSVLILLKSMSTLVFLSTFGDILPIPGSTCIGWIYIEGKSFSIRSEMGVTTLG